MASTGEYKSPTQLRRENPELRRAYTNQKYAERKARDPNYRKEYNAEHYAKNKQSGYEKRKARMAVDPAYKEKVKADTKAWRDKNRPALEKEWRDRYAKSHCKVYLPEIDPVGSDTYGYTGVVFFQCVMRHMSARCYNFFRLDQAEAAREIAYQFVAKLKCRKCGGAMRPRDQAKIK